jgi:hypothetical protein
MPLVSALIRLPSPLLQVASFPDTIVARTIVDRGVYDWITGTLIVLVLLLSAGALIALIGLLATMRQGVARLNSTLERVVADAQPMLQNANAMVGDARAMVAQVKQDVSRISGGAGAFGDTLRDAADVTAQRLDELNAVLDVVQEEVEQTVITATSAVRGVRMGAQEMLSHLPHRRRRQERTPFDDPAEMELDDDADDDLDEYLDDDEFDDVNAESQARD